MRRSQRRARNVEQTAAEERRRQAIADAERAFWAWWSRSGQKPFLRTRRSQQDPIIRRRPMRERNRLRWFGRYPL